jgi:hypothetical protein
VSALAISPRRPDPYVLDLDTAILREVTATVTLEDLCHDLMTYYPNVKGTSRANVSKHCKALASRGLVQWQHNGRYITLRPPPAGRDCTVSPSSASHPDDAPCRDSATGAT